MVSHPYLRLVLAQLGPRPGRRQGLRRCLEDVDLPGVPGFALTNARGGPELPAVSLAGLSRRGLQEVSLRGGHSLSGRFVTSGYKWFPAPPRRMARRRWIVLTLRYATARYLVVMMASARSMEPWQWSELVEIADMQSARLAMA
jgi:hypothetical protein